MFVLRRAGNGRQCIAKLTLAATLLGVALNGVSAPAEHNRADGLYPQFVAPCCWRQSVAVHSSPQALHVRAEIDEAVAAGKSDDEIKSALVREYGHGILMEPEGSRAMAAYGGPILALMIGLVFASMWVRKNVKPAQISEPGTPL